MDRLGKYLRRATLSLMFLLTVGANCFCASYDSDPYDDTPPVTLEFNFVKPPAVATHSGRHKADYDRIRVAGMPVALFSDNSSRFVVQPVTLDQAQSAAPLFPPLRT